MRQRRTSGYVSLWRACAGRLPRANHLCSFSMMFSGPMQLHLTCFPTQRDIGERRRPVFFSCLPYALNRPHVPPDNLTGFQDCHATSPSQRWSLASFPRRRRCSWCDHSLASRLKGEVSDHLKQVERRENMTSNASVDGSIVKAGDIHSSSSNCLEPYW